MTKRKFEFPVQTKRIGKCLAAVLPIHGVWTEPEYVCVRYEGKQWRGHILSFKLNVGQITNFTLHHCDHKWCIEPSHLYQGNHQDNIRDFHARHGKSYSKSMSDIMKKVCSDPKIRKRLSDNGKKRLSNPKHRMDHIERMKTRNPMQLMSEKDKKKFFLRRSKRKSAK